MNPLPFRLGEIYKRADINAEFGGSYRSGIAPSAKYPYIFIFSGKSGHIHGYKDQWENPDVFSYTGEGQLGDMEMVKGNLALQNHLHNGKKVFLFIQTSKGYVRFESELELIDIGTFPALDRTGKERIGIKFFFKRAGAPLSYEKELREEINIQNNIPEQGTIPTITERQGLVTSRVGQGAYRKSILHRWQFKCAVTNYTKHEILIASHIVPWKDATNEERLDVNNGILLSPSYDALFDRHLISFENNGRIILSKSLLKSNYERIGVTGKEVIKDMSQANIPFLSRHRERLFVL